MSDITKINTDYYGEKEEWLNLPGASDNTMKVPKWGNLKNAYDTGTLENNKRLDSSLYMFGIKGDSDFLYPCSMIYNADSGYKLFRDTKEVTEISYFGMLNSTIISEAVLWNENNNTITGNNNMINGTGLKYPVQSNYTPMTYPLIDFTYNNLCSLVYVSITKQNENSITETTITLDEYLTNKSNYVDYDLNCYWHNIRGGTKVNRTYARYYSNVNSEFPKNELIKYTVFSYFPRYSILGGGIGKNLVFEANSNNKNFEICFFANPKYWTIKEYKYNTSGLKYYKTVFLGSDDDLIKLCSYIGINFTGNANSSQYSELGENCTDDKIYMPVIEDGILSGKYVNGKDVAKLPNAKWENNIRENTGYKGIDSIDPTEYTNKIDLSNPLITSAGAFNTFYAMSQAELNSLADELWTADENKFKQILDGLLLMGENPLDVIISLQLYPFSLTEIATSFTAQPIKLGRVQLDTTGAKISGLKGIINLGSINLRKNFNNFLDFEPYSTAFLYIPYCGTVQISLNDFIGKSMSIEMIIDYNTGVCTAVVFSDGIPILYKNGAISSTISISGTDSATMSANMISSSLNMLTNTTSLLAGGKDSSSIISGSANILSSGFDYSAQRTIYNSQGANTPQVNMYQPQKPYIVINRPKVDINEKFGHFHGFRCDFYDKIENLSGYIECDTPILNDLTATETEKEMIIEILRGGLYV